MPAEAVLEATSPPPQANRSPELYVTSEKSPLDEFVATPPPSAPAFTSEELPPDFWDDEPVPPPSEASLERPRNPAAAPGALGEDAPLFDQLQQLFPGRIVRIDPLKAVDENLTDEDPAPEDAAVQDSLFD